MDFTFRNEWREPQGLAADATGMPQEREPVPARAALAAARGVAPENLTQTQRLSTELALPDSLIQRAPEQALELLRARQLEMNPHLAGWAGRSVQNAAHARENVEYLNRFSDAFESIDLRVSDALMDEFQQDAAFPPQKGRSFAEFMDALGRPGEQLLHTASEVWQNVGDTVAHGMADVNTAFAGAALAVAENVFGTESASARWLRQARDWADRARPREVKADTTLGQFGYDALRIAPQLAATIAGSAVNPVVAAGVMGSQIFGSSYNELRRKGVSPRGAWTSAGANAAMQLPMERLGFEKLLRAIRATGVREALQRWFGAALTEGLTEGAQKAPEFVTHLWAEAERQGPTVGERVDWFSKQVMDADNLMQATRDAIYEGLLGFAWGGLFGGVGVVRSRRQERYARQGRADATATAAETDAPETTGILDAPEVRELLTAEAEQASAMAQRQALGNALTQATAQLEDAPAQNDPVALRQMVDVVLPEQFRQAWIGPDDAVRLYQAAQERGGTGAAALLQTLGTDEAGLAAAQEQGDPLPVSTAAVLAQLAGEERTGVMQALRVTPDGVSGVEAAAYDPQARAEALVRSVLDLAPDGAVEDGTDGDSETRQDDTRDAGDALRQARSAQRVRADVRREITRITGEIEAAGYARHAARTFASLMEQAALTAHAVYGVDPVSFILQRINVARGGEASQEGHAVPEERDNANVESNKEQGRIEKQNTTEPIAWDLMMDENYLSENALMDLDMTRHVADTAFLSADTKKLPVLDPSGMRYKDFREGLSRWRKKYPEGRGLKEIEEHLDWIEAENTARGYRELYQNNNPIEISGATLGVPEGSGIRDYIRAAKKYHDRLRYESEHGKPVVQPQLDKPVRFSQQGWKKNTHAGADRRKWQLFPHLREIIESSRLVRTEKPHGKHAKMAYAHWLESDIILDGQPLTAGFTLFEDEKGNLFYNIAADISETSKGKAPRSFKPSAQILDSEGLHQDGNPSVEATIRPDPDGVNLTIAEAAPGVLRGSVTLSPREAAIRVFADKNLSTVPHEAAHIFLDDLMRIAADDGSLALAGMRAALADAVRPMGREMRAEIEAAADAAAGATPEALAEALHTAETGLRERARDARATARINREAAKAMRREAGVAEDDASANDQPVPRPGEAAPWQELENAQRLAASRAADYTRAATIIGRAARHVRALRQARQDVADLKTWAGIAPDAELAPGTEEYTRFHETVARGFEQYLMEGRAPSRTLAAVFSRLRHWLLRVYEAAREQLGLAINDDVRRVFDRMLATDAELAQKHGLRRAMAAERKFTNSDGLFYFDELEALNQLRNEAERAVTAEMDRATLRERNKRYKAYYRDALEDIGLSPFWQMVDALSRREKSATGDASVGGINRDGVVRLLGQSAAADLARARPGLLNARNTGLPIDLAAMEHGYADEDALAHDLYDALVVRGESKKSLARALAEQRLAEDDRAAEADALLHGSESYAAYLDKVDEVVLRMAAEQGYRSRKEQARFVRNSIVPRSVIRNQAWLELQHTKLGDMRPERYQARLDKALRERARALADGNAMAAVNAVQDARVANELEHLSRQFLQRRDELVQLARKTASARAGTFPPLYAAALGKLLGRFGLGKMRGETDPVFALASLRDLVQQTAPEEDTAGIAPSFADWLLDGINPATGFSIGDGTLRLNGLTPFEMEEVENLLKYLRHAGYDARADARNTEAAKVALLEEAAAKAMHALPDGVNAPANTLRRSAQEGSRMLYAAIDSLRWQFRKADGFQNVMGQGEAGPMEQMLGEMLGGEERARARVDEISKLMAPHLVHLSQSVAAWEKKYGTQMVLKGRDGRPVPVPKSLSDAYKLKGWTADMVLALALNCGNESNMVRLVTGYPDLSYDMLAELLGDAMATRAFNTARGLRDAPAVATQVATDGDNNSLPQQSANETTVAIRKQAKPANGYRMGTLAQGGNRAGLLSAQDWQAVQGIWDALATQWEDTQEVHERMFGFRPKGVEATPFRVTEADGTVVSLRGGYYPVRYDPNISETVADWGEKEDLLSRNESAFAVPAAKRGHTQARQQNAPGLPVRLNTGIILEHINDVVRLIELGEITRRADRVTRGDAFRAEYIRAYGRQDYDAIRPNLRGIVRQEPPPKGDVAVLAANFVRRYLVPWGLAWNIKVAAVQLTAVFPAMGDLGAEPMLRSMAHMARHPFAIREIWAVSPYMKSRMNNIDQDLQRSIANFTPERRPLSLRVGNREITWDDVVNAGMLPIVAMDTVATGAVWMAAYTKKLSALQGAKDVRYGINTDSDFHEQAVAFADSMVKQSNPDYDPTSRSGFLRAQNAYRLLNGFASAVTLFAARHKYMYTARKKGKISRLQLARFELYETILPGMFTFMVLALMRGYLFGDKDDAEDIAKLALGSLADVGSMRVPIFGSALGDGLLSMMGLGEGGRQGGLRTTIDEPLRQIGALTGSVGQVVKKGMRKDTVKNLSYAVGDVLSFAIRVPFSKLARNAERGYDQWQRGEGTPFSMLMPRPGK